MCIAPASNQSSDFTAFIAMTVSVRAGQVRICYHGPCSNSLHAHCPSGHPPRPVGPSPMFLLSVREWLWRCLVLLRAAAHSHHCPLFICHCHFYSLFKCNCQQCSQLICHCYLFSLFTCPFQQCSLFICHCHVCLMFICRHYTWSRFRCHCQ